MVLNGVASLSVVENYKAEFREHSVSRSQAYVCCENFIDEK